MHATEVRTAAKETTLRDALLMAGGFALALAAAAQVRILLPNNPVPITLQTFILYSGAVVLATRTALAGVGLYVGLALIGLPVLSGLRGGLAAFGGATGRLRARLVRRRLGALAAPRSAAELGSHCGNDDAGYGHHSLLRHATSRATAGLVSGTGVLDGCGALYSRRRAQDCGSVDARSPLAFGVESLAAPNCYPPARHSAPAPT